MYVSKIHSLMCIYAASIINEEYYIVENIVLGQSHVQINALTVVNQSELWILLPNKA